MQQQIGQKKKKKKVETKLHKNMKSGFTESWNDGSSLFQKAFALSQMDSETE